MATQIRQSVSRALWRLARKQHWVITRQQLLAAGLTPEAIRERVRKGRLHPLEWRGVYGVGRPELSREGRWMAAVLACGPGAALSGESAAACLGIRDHEIDEVEITVPPGAARDLAGIRVRRRRLGDGDLGECDRIPVTSPVRTLLDLATKKLTDAELERAINDADRLDLIDPEALREALAKRAASRECGRLRSMLDHRTFTLTDSHARAAACCPSPAAPGWASRRPACG